MRGFQESPNNQVQRPITFELEGRTIGETGGSLARNACRIMMIDDLHMSLA